MPKSQYAKTYHNHSDQTAEPIVKIVVHALILFDNKNNTYTCSTFDNNSIKRCHTICLSKCRGIQNYRPSLRHDNGLRYFIVVVLFDYLTGTIFVCDLLYNDLIFTIYAIHNSFCVLI